MLRAVFLDKFSERPCSARSVARFSSKRSSAARASCSLAKQPRYTRLEARPPVPYRKAQSGSPPASGEVSLNTLNLLPHNDRLDRPRIQESHRAASRASDNRSRTEGVTGSSRQRTARRVTEPGSPRRINSVATRAHPPGEASSEAGACGVRHRCRAAGTLSIAGSCSRGWDAYHRT